MCRHAVDSSQGKLIDIRIAYFGNNKLLHYIFGRSCQLKRLTLKKCGDISDSSLIKACKKILQLEELHLLSMTMVSAKSIKLIGKACPMLKSFTARKIEFHDQSAGDNDIALAIAKSMPGLRHLQLYKDRLTNCGLEAILDGCPLLESLDLQGCFEIDLDDGDLWRRCTRQINYVRYPYDEHYQSF